MAFQTLASSFRQKLSQPFLKISSSQTRLFKLTDKQPVGAKQQQQRRRQQQEQQRRRRRRQQTGPHLWFSFQNLSQATTRMSTLQVPVIVGKCTRLNYNAFKTGKSSPNVTLNVGSFGLILRSISLKLHS